jgi:hypothetical protein
MTTPHPDGVTLSGYVDDALAPAARVDVAAHVASCRECQAMVDGLREISAAARRLAPLAPRREAWNRIERSLRAEGTSHARRRPLWPWLAAAAAILVTTLVGFKVSDLRRQSAPATSTAGPDVATAQSVEAELAQAEQHYQKAIAGLEQIANAEKGTLDPQTASTLEKNLTVIDQAISESRAALRAQPASEPAQASLLENFKSKIALLQETIALINEMRKGNDTGAGRAVSGLKQKG